MSDDSFKEEILNDLEDTINQYESIQTTINEMPDICQKNLRNIETLLTNVGYDLETPVELINAVKRIFDPINNILSTIPLDINKILEECKEAIRLFLETHRIPTIEVELIYNDAKQRMDMYTKKVGEVIRFKVYFYRNEQLLNFFEALRSTSSTNQVQYCFLSEDRTWHIELTPKNEHDICFTLLNGEDIQGESIETELRQIQIAAFEAWADTIVQFRTRPPKDRIRIFDRVVRRF